MKYTALTTAFFAATVAAPLAAENRIDGLSPGAPELAPYGDFSVGARQFNFLNPDQIDILAINPAAPRPADLPRYDRPLTVEMWYPAIEAAMGETSVNTFLRDGVTPVTLEGRAVRDAAALDVAEPLPLIMMSHGYPGNRFLMSHLAGNLASKGYVVASIDHTDSTYTDQSAFGSTLVNRSLDQMFVLDQLAAVNAVNADAGSDLAGRIDTNNTGLVGYSMGGYGAIISAGGGVTNAAVNSGFAPFDTLGIHKAGSDTHEALVDPRIKTAIAIGPWGRQVGFFDEEGLSGINIPMFYIGGSNDVTSGYETGIRQIWKETTNADRALLTFDGGSHNTVAPILAPEESFFFSDALGFNVSEHYSDPVWDTVFMNNVGQHFATAWFDELLKGDKAKGAYLDLTDLGSEGFWSLNDDGSFAGDRTYWAGFSEGTADGIRFETLAAAPAPVPLPASFWLLGLAVGGLGALRRKRKTAA